MEFIVRVRVSTNRNYVPEKVYRVYNENATVWIEETQAALDEQKSELILGNNGETVEVPQLFKLQDLPLAPREPKDAARFLIGEFTVSPVMAR